MITYYQHPYLLASTFDNLAIDFYKKYIISQSEKTKKYDFDNLENKFFLGYRPNCVLVFINNNRQEAIINNFTYFTKYITKNPIRMAIKIIKEKYKNVKVIKLTDNSTINCGIHKFPLYIYMILYYGKTYYMKYGFLPENKSRNLEFINIRINEKTIKLDNIIEFTKNGIFPEEINKDFIKLSKKIIKKNNKLKYFLEEIKFIKDKGKKGCNYFFSLLDYIYKIFFPAFNFFQESYYLTKIV
jgi:hypothetical protein